jgi:RNA polymerase sigma-70 factor (family 1)
LTLTSLNLLPERELVDLLRSGDQAAYTEIYNRYSWLLHTHAYKKLGDREAANDVIQELFASLWTKRETVFLNTTLAGYLYTAVRNRILNMIEHQQVETKYIDSMMEFSAEYTAVTDHLIREKQMMSIIDKEIAALPPKMRAVFELSRKSHLSHKEIAEQLDISEQTVTKQIKNALKILKARLPVMFYFILLNYLK